MVLLCEQTQVTLQQQQLLYNGKEMKNAERLGALGVGEGDLVMMVSLSNSSSRCDLRQSIGLRRVNY